MDPISEIALQQKLKHHRVWLDSTARGQEPAQGEQLVLVDRAILGIHLKNVDLSLVELVHCTFSNIRCENCDLSNTVLIDSVFQDCELAQCQFVKADLRGVEAVNTTFAGSDFTRADFTDAKLAGTNLSDCVFHGAWLVNTDLRHAVLEQVDMEGAYLIRTKLYNEQRYHLLNLDTTTVEDVDLSREGNAAHIADKAALIALLLRTK